MQYAETHFHGDAGGVEVRLAMRGRGDDGGTLRSEPKLIIGAVGILQLDYKADIQRDVDTSRSIRLDRQGRILRPLAHGTIVEGEMRIP